MLGMPGFPVPSVEEITELTTRLGRRTNPAIRCGGYAFNTAAMTDDAAAELMAKESRRLGLRSEEHTSELQSLMRSSYAVFCLKKKKNNNRDNINNRCCKETSQHKETNRH